MRIAKLKSELKQHETSCASQWATAQQDGPYEKGSHPFKEYFVLAYWLLRSELQLWGSTLPSTEDSLKVFVNICEALIAEISRVLVPVLAHEKSKTSNPVVRKVLCSRQWVVVNILERERKKKFFFSLSKIFITEFVFLNA